jgi:hypothetical protein
MIVFAVVLVGITVGTVVYGVCAWHWPDFDHLAALTATFAVGTFALAVVAGVIAFAAYLVATQSPDLEVEIRFPFSETSHPVLMRHPVQIRAGDGYPFLANFRQLEAQVVVHNKSPFAAHNPACRVELVGLAGLRNAGPQWDIVVDRDPAIGDPVTVQWDGGADFIIHGNWERFISLDFRSTVDLVAGPGEHRIDITLVADGFSRTWPIAVEVTDAADWIQRHPAVHNQVPQDVLDLVEGGPVENPVAVPKADS